MKVTKKGFVHKPAGNLGFSQSHAQVPFAFPLSETRLRVYYSTRDHNGKSRPTFLEVNRQRPTEILKEVDYPCLDLGRRGCFDESGVMPSWFLSLGDEVWMYYTGWNVSETAAYRLGIGLAISRDGGNTFTRKHPGPLLDRGPNDPVWVAQPCVRKEGDLWRMWYLSCQKVELIDGQPEPFYNVRYAESDDGLNWQRKEITSLELDKSTDAIGRPSVWKRGGEYFMFHSNRLAYGYRDQVQAGYRIELSRSTDGIVWESDDNFMLPKSADGWDSIMNGYCSVDVLSEQRCHVFYNGNGFGASGFGYFTLEW